MTYLGVDGKTVANKSTDVAATVCGIESGAVRTEFLGLDGKLTVHRILGVSSMTERWFKSAAGSKMVISYYDKSRKPVARRDIRAAQLVFSFDDEHRLVDLDVRPVESLVQRQKRRPTWLRRLWNLAGRVFTYVGAALMGLYLFTLVVLPLLRWAGTAAWKALRKSGSLPARLSRGRLPKPSSNAETAVPAASAAACVAVPVEEKSGDVPAGSGSVLSLYLQVISTYSAGNYDCVLAKVDEYVSQNPSEALGYSLRGTCLASKWSSRKGEPAEARQGLLDKMNTAYREALARDPSRADCHMEVLQGMILMRDWEGALTFGEGFRTLLKTPRDHFLWSWLVNIACALSGRPLVADTSAAPGVAYIGHGRDMWHSNEMEALLKLLEREGFDPAKLSAARAVHKDVLARQKKPTTG